jgi:hypothetical protein
MYPWGASKHIIPLLITPPMVPVCPKRENLFARLILPLFPISEYLHPYISIPLLSLTLLAELPSMFLSGSTILA